MGEWPGLRRTFPRGFGVDTAVPFGDNPPLTRCWLFAGGPRLGSGPDVGTRRPAAGLCLGVGAAGRDGGGIRPELDFDAGFGGGGIADTLCALLAAGKEGTGGGGMSFLAFSEFSSSFKVKDGTLVSGTVGTAFGVLSPSAGLGSPRKLFVTSALLCFKAWPFGADMRAGRSMAISCGESCFTRFGHGPCSKANS